MQQPLTDELISDELAELTAARVPGWHSPTVEEELELAEAIDRHEREEEAHIRELEAEEAEMFEEDARFIRDLEAKAEAEINDDLEGARLVERIHARDPQPGDAEEIAHYYEDASRRRLSLAIDRRYRRGPWFSTRRPPARRARSCTGARRRPRGRRSSRATSTGPPGDNDGPGERPGAGARHHDVEQSRRAVIA